MVFSEEERRKKGKQGKLHADQHQVKIITCKSCKWIATIIKMIPPLNTKNGSPFFTNNTVMVTPVMPLPGGPHICKFLFCSLFSLQTLITFGTCHFLRFSVSCCVCILIIAALSQHAFHHSTDVMCDVSLVQFNYLFSQLLLALISS